MTQFSDLQGLTLTAVDQVEDELIIFKTSGGRKFYMYHSQSCCEDVRVESVIGDLRDLIGTPILLAEEATSEDDPVDKKWEDGHYCDSQTWTFYKLRTIIGSVDIRWYGHSNGCYSERVSFDEVK